jgi:hypothetical protein
VLLNTGAIANLPSGPTSFSFRMVAYLIFNVILVYDVSRCGISKIEAGQTGRRRSQGN